MKYRKLRFLSVVCVASLIISQGAIAANSVDNGDPGSTSGYSQTDVTPISVDDLEIKVEKKEYNGNTTANATVTVKPDLLNGKNVTVKYTAAAFDNENAGENKAVTISGLHLEGEDKDAFRLDVEEKTVNDGVITQRIVELTPNDTQLHYTSDEYPKSGIPVTYDSTKIFDNGVSGSIPKTVFIVYNDDNDEKYFYSLEENKIETEKALANPNYKVKISSTSKVNVVPNAPELNNATLSPVNNRVKILFYKGIGFVANGKVNAKLSAQSKYNEGLKYYIKSDENKHVKEALPANYIGLDTIDNNEYRAVDIQCAVEGKAKSEYSQLTYEYNGNSSQTLLIDKEKPTNKNDKPLELVTKNESQQLLLSGTVCDNGSGINSVSYTWKNNGTDIKKELSDFQKGTNELAFNSVPLMNYSELPDDNKIKVTVTDLAGNTNNFELSCENVGVELAEPVITSITLKSGEKTELDKLLNILSFGIYSKNEELTLEIKAEPAEFDVKDKNVTVRLLRKNDEGELVVFNNLTQTKEVDKDPDFTFDLANEAVADQLSVEIENAYERVLTIPLKKALEEGGQWNKETTETTDKWVFDKTPPQISLSLDSRLTQEEKEEGFEPRSIRNNFGQFEISANDSSGISLFKVYNVNDDEYRILDEDDNEFFIVNSDGKKFSIIKPIENGFELTDGTDNMEVFTIKEEISVDNPEDPDNPTKKEIYKLADKDNNSYSFSNDSSEYSLSFQNDKNTFIVENEIKTVTLHIEEVHSFYKVYDDKDKIANLSEENANVHCLINSEQLLKGNNEFVVRTKDNAGNESNETYTVEVLEEAGKADLILTDPTPDKTMLEKNGEYWINESAIDNNLKKDSTDPESNQSVSEKFPLTLKLSLSSSDIMQIQSINYFVIKDDKDADSLEKIERWNVNKRYNIDNKIKNNEQLLQLNQEDYDKIKNTNNFNNNVIHIKSKIKYIDKTEQDNDIVIHVDKKSPEIGTFKVEKTNDSVEDIIHILTFGIFCNNQVKISTEVTDAVNDVGIDSVSFFSDYDNNKKKLTTENDGNRYYIILPGDTKIYQTGIKVVAADKLGNESTQSLDTSNVKAEDGTLKKLKKNLVLIESNPPVAEIGMPVPTHEADSQKWFDAKDQEISLKVSDFGSGIRSIKVLVNGNPVTNAVDSSYMLDSVTEPIQDAVSALESDDFILSKDNSIHQGKKITVANYKFSINELIKAAGNSDGEYTLQVYVIDNAGNVSVEEESQVIFYRDIEQPEITSIVFSSADSNGRKNTDDYKLIDQNDYIKKTDYGYYFQSGFTLKINAKDKSDSSGLKTATVRFMKYNDNGMYSEVKSVTVNFNTGTGSGKDVEGESESVTIDSGFKGMILAEVTDNTGNVSGEYSPRAFVSDNESPTIEIKKDIKPLKVNGSDNEYLKGSDNEYLYTENAVFTVTITDEKSGLKSIEYSTESDANNYESVKGGLKAEDLDNKFIDETNRRYIIVEGSDCPEIGETGWKVTKTDLNVVTKIQKTFTYGDIVDTINQYQDGKVHYLDDKNIVL